MNNDVEESMTGCNQGVSLEASGLAYGISNCKSQIAKVKS
jgi:hypothetical protein